MPVPGANVRFALTSGTVQPILLATAGTDSKGVAKFTFDPGNRTGQVTITSTVAGIPAVTFQLQTGR